MSQLNVSSSNSSQINIINNSHDADVSDVLGNELKKDFEEKTDLRNIEQLKTDLNAKPESTLHKVGRFLSGILGGILLAAGIAAATVATCGIAAGVAAAGIGLIATSVALRPKNPGASAQQLDLQGVKPDPNTGDDGTLRLTGMGAGETTAILKALATNHNVEPRNIPHESETGRNLGVLLSSVDPDTHAIDKEFATPFAIKTCVKGILGQNGVTEFEAGEKNFLLVRHAIDAYFGQLRGVMKEEDAAALNSPEAKQGFDAIIENAKNKLSPDSEDYKLLSIFQGALNLESVELARPQQAMQGITGSVLWDPTQTKEVSLQEQEQVISSMLPKEITFDEGAEKAIMKVINKLIPNYGGEVGINDPQKMDQFMRWSSFEPGKIAIDAEYAADFTSAILNDYGIKEPYELTPKNVILVRYAIASFFSDPSNGFQEELLLFNSPDGQKQIADAITTKMEECRPGGPNPD